MQPIKRCADFEILPGGGGGGPSCNFFLAENENEATNNYTCIRVCRSNILTEK